MLFHLALQNTPFCSLFSDLIPQSEALNTSEVDETVVVARDRKIVTKKLQLEDPANVPSNFIDYLK